ncbi:hypothetical protein [Pseudaminobacter soli (ex Li et al. 2025)]|uniref:DUF4189 domain-containing protein n=1 Tax=Pseudaminobacter soli (ex Li et al. 2025) TaxID=1295366 RepID=A0A2P7SFM1_9HYPH|nr:hypothetical protein [Mesorhizobium soli]PSJ61304.1 hypothetical protein C7I85_09505 [Mesorhizobium soli]
MILKYITPAAKAVAIGILIASAASTATAESLAGSAGNKRHAVFFSPYLQGNCREAYDAYVAAPGHSAYASTVSGRNIPYFICGLHRNAPSQKQAEEFALKNCEAGLRKYKFRTASACNIVASK